MKHEIQSYLQDKTREASIILRQTRDILNEPEPNSAQITAALDLVLEEITRCIKTLRQAQTEDAAGVPPKTEFTRTAPRRNS